MFFRLSSRELGLELLERYTDASTALSEAVPGSRAATAIAEGDRLQRELWAWQGTRSRACRDAQRDVDMQTVRVAALNNRVPSAVLAIEIIGAAVALGLLALYLAARGDEFRRAHRSVGERQPLSRGAPWPR